MERWACADLPSLALQILLEAHPDWRGLPVAVVDKDTAQGVILQSNRIARQFQIKPGLRYASGLSLSSDLRAAVVSDDDVRKTCSKLLDSMHTFSPHVEADRTQRGLYWLRVTGLDRLFKGFDTWSKGLFEHLRETHGLLASITVGWTRFGTLAASRGEPAGWRVFDDLEHEQKYQGGVSLDILGLSPAITEKLDKLAVTRVDQFLALPSSGVRKRFGAEAAALWRFAHGGGEVPLQPLAWDEPVCSTHSLDDALSDMTQLTFLLKASLHPLMLELAGRHCDLRELSVALHLDDGDVHEVAIRPATPTLDEVRIVELCRLRFERLTLPAPIVSLVIEAHGVLIHRDQSHLFRDNAKRDLQVANHALARLRAEHPDAVCKVVPQDRHLPEAKFALEPLESLSRARPAKPARKTGVRRIFGRPQPLPRFDPEIGFGWLVRDLDEGVVMKTYGPHRVSGGWWMDGNNAVDHIVRRRLADTSTHHVSPRARYFARDGEFVDAAAATDEAEESMSSVAPHRGEIPKSTRHFPRHPKAAHVLSDTIGLSRDYWYAETDRGDIFWIYWDHRRRQWFLHGVVE